MRVLCVRCRVLRSSPLYGVPLPCLHSVRTASPQPCFPLRRAFRRVRPHRSPIGRLPSGASASLRHRSAQRPLGCRGRCGARLARARWRLWDGSPLRHRGFRFSPRCAIHPRMRLAWLGRSGGAALPAPCNAASRRLTHPGAESALATWSAPPIPPALFAECRRKRCRLHLSICATLALRTSLAHQESHSSNLSHLSHPRCAIHELIGRGARR
jgi:hypothetical protein